MAIQDEIELLRPAVERLRVVLRRMDSADVPARLRPLTKSSARRVPPPLLQGAVDALDGDEWLRTQVVEKGDALDTEASQRPEAASALFLLRPETWEEEFTKLVAESEETSLAGKVARLEQQRRKDVLTIKRLRTEIKDLRRQRDSVVAGTTEPYHEDMAEENERLAKSEARRAEVEKLRVELEERSLNLEEELRVIRSRLESTRQALERERRKPSGTVEADTVAGMPGSPETVASTLDRVMLSVRRETLTEEWVAPDQEIETPPASPDTPDAVAELIGDRRVWLIDGYNVSYLLAGRRPESMDRLRLESRLGRLLGKAARGTTVTVYWDSSEGVDSRSGGPGVAVRFVPSADEAIIEHAGPTTVVVSTDRRVREESEEKGAIPLWSEALIGWFGT